MSSRRANETDFYTFIIIFIIFEHYIFLYRFNFSFYLSSYIHILSRKCLLCKNILSSLSAFALSFDVIPQGSRLEIALLFLASLLIDFAIIF